MQDEISKIIEKHKKEWPEWVAQFELIARIINDLKLNDEGVQPNICRALKRMRIYEELPFKPISVKPGDKFYYLIILKKVNRTDLIGEKNRFRRGSFLYKIK